MFAPVLKKSKSFSGTVDTSKSTEESAPLTQSLQFDSILDLPPTSDSGVFNDDFRSSNESCDSVTERSRPSSADKEKDDTSDWNYFSSESDTVMVVSESVDLNGNREKIYADGRKEIWCANGSVKKISSDGKITKTIFYNGDVEEVNVDENVVKYYHAGSKTWHSKFGDGLEIKEFPELVRFFIFSGFMSS